MLNFSCLNLFFCFYIHFNFIFFIVSYVLCIFALYCDNGLKIECLYVVVLKQLSKLHKVI